MMVPLRRKEWSIRVSWITLPRPTSDTWHQVITSKADELVTPAPSVSFIDETGVSNILIQDVCPLGRAFLCDLLTPSEFSPCTDKLVGHISEIYDTNTWNIVLNALQNKPDRKFICTIGSPGKWGLMSPFTIFDFATIICISFCCIDSPFLSLFLV